MAVKKIRGAAGRIRGLGLAVFDGLFLPVAPADLIIFFGWSLAAKALAAHRGLGGSMFRDLWEFTFFSLLIGGTVAIANYVMISPIWHAVTRAATAGIFNAVVSTRRKILVVAILSGLVATVLVPAAVFLDEGSRKARYGWAVEPGTTLAYQVFEATADVVDRAMSFDARAPGNAISKAGVYMPAAAYTSSAQMVEIEDTVLTVLRDQAGTNAGILTSATKKGDEIYQWRPDSWSYNTGEVQGKGEGFCGMGRDLQSNRFRIRYRITHILEGNTRFPVTAEISYEGPVPAAGKARAFLIPFGREQRSEYLVIAFSVKSAGKDEWPAPTGEK
jgi:hypothetical protein